MIHEHDAPSILVLPRLEESDIEQLADVLVDCVESGASVSFMQPMTRAKAVDFWTRAAAESRGGSALCWLPATRPASSARCK